MSDKKKSTLSNLAKKGIKAGAKASVKAGKFVKEVIDEAQENSKQNMIVNTQQYQSKPIQNKTSIDEQIEIWQGWFYGGIVYVFVIIISFMIAVQDSRFTILAWILLIGFPFFVFKGIVNSIPEVKIGNRVIFSRQNFSYRDQLSFTSTVFKGFSKEMYRANPQAASILIVFIIFLIFITLRPFFS